MLQHRGRVVLAVTSLLVMALAGPVAAAKPGSDGGGGGLERGPILFVHGWNSTASTWDTMVDNFLADGWTADQLFTWSYDYSQSNEVTAEEVLARIEDIRATTGATTVDVVTHSMGGLSSRWCIKFLACDGQVDEWVSLGGPNHGTDTANFCYDTSCYEMRIGSSFLETLNAGDETPGTSTRWRTWWSPCDTVINPDSSVPLDGATNTKTRCISHNALTTDSTVYGQVRDFVGAS